MKKIIFLYLFPVFTWATQETQPKESLLYREAQPTTKPKATAQVYGTIQVRAGYVGFTSSLLRNIYGHEALDLEIEGSVKVASYAFFWSNLNYTWKNGHSTSESQHTRLDLAILSAGFNLAVPIRSSTLIYLGLGISGAGVHTSDHSSFLPKYTTRFGVGCVAKSGLFIPFSNHLFLNPFFDYYYQPIHTRNAAHHTIDVGGFRTGLGIGYYF